MCFHHLLVQMDIYQIWIWVTDMTSVRFQNRVWHTNCHFLLRSMCSVNVGLTVRSISEPIWCHHVITRNTEFKTLIKSIFLCYISTSHLKTVHMRFQATRGVSWNHILLIITRNTKTKKPTPDIVLKRFENKYVHSSIFFACSLGLIFHTTPPTCL